MANNKLARGGGTYAPPYTVFLVGLIILFLFIFKLYYIYRNVLICATFKQRKSHYNNENKVALSDNPAYINRNDLFILCYDIKEKAYLSRPYKAANYTIYALLTLRYCKPI